MAPGCRGEALHVARALGGDPAVPRAAVGGMTLTFGGPLHTSPDFLIFIVNTVPSIMDVT